MSIILRALKKVQEQEAEQRAGSAPGQTASVEGGPPDASADASPTAGQAGAGADSVAYRMAATGGDRLLSSQVLRHSFGLAPKALLVLLVVLGLCTTGWFASRIYLNLKLASEASAAKASVGSAVGEPVEYAQAVEAAEKAPLPAKEGSSAVTVESSETSEVIYYTAESPVMEPLEPERPIAAVKEAIPEKKGRPKLKINAIAWKNEEPRAIVNMQRVYEGDLIEGARVLAIKRKIIVFEYEGETFEVRF